MTEQTVPAPRRGAAPARPFAARLAQVIGTAAIFSLFNLLSSAFQIADGVSILFPGTAVSILSCMYFGAWGALGTFLGTLATPWGTLEQAWQLFMSGGINALEGLIPYLVFRFSPTLARDLRDMRSLVTFLLFGVVLNTGFSAVLGNVFVVQQQEGSGLGVKGVLVWWIADFSAALLIATPILAFAGGVAKRLGAQTDAKSDRTLRNALQITAATIILGWGTSAVLRNYLITRIESERLLQQDSLSRASLLTNQIHSNFLFAMGLELQPDAMSPESRAELARARALNGKLLAELAPLASAAGSPLKFRYAELDNLTSTWFDERVRALANGTSTPAIASSHILSRKVLMLKSEVDLQNVEAWQTFAQNRRRIMTISMFTDVAVFGILALAAMQLIFGMSRPLRLLHDELGNVSDGGRFDRSRIDSGYAELRELANTLHVTFDRLGERERQLKQQTEMALEASRHKSEFLAKMSHELRTPLNSIVGFTDLLIEQERVIDPVKRRTFLENVGRSGRHLLNLINDLLDLAKLESGRIHIDWQELDVRRVVENSVAITSPLFRGRHQHVEIILPDHPVHVRSDARRLEQIMLNLLSNANKFSPERSMITCAVTAEARQCTIEVRDRGIGIPEADVARIFNEFEQLHARGEYSRGAGLGLALVKRFVEALGGRIVVSSRPGEGSSFRILLPYREQRRSDYANRS